MLASIPHHRFSVQGRLGALHYNVQADLSAPWTIFFGPSGSGKSTLLRAIAGLTPGLRTTFERFTDGGQPQDLATLKPQHRNLAFDPQGATLFAHLSVANNIRFPELVRNIPEAASQLPELTGLLDLAPLLGKNVHQLSGGERQRVSLARALAVPEAELLLLDEPFTGLDRSHRDALLPRLQEHLATRNLPALSVTHDPDEALLLQAEILRIDLGQLIAHGPASHVLRDEIDRLRRLLTTTAGSAIP